MDTTASPTNNTLPLRVGGFASLADALDYAAGGVTGYNFHTGRGELWATLTYAALRERALELARRLVGLGLERGARVALVADTNPESIACTRPSPSLSRSSSRISVVIAHWFATTCGSCIVLSCCHPGTSSSDQVPSGQPGRLG